MKDGRTRLAHKANRAVDLETGAVVGVSVQDADAGDTQTMLETLVIAAEQVDTVQPAGPGIAELVCDKGYHSNQALVTLAALGIRSYVSEPARGRRHWRGKPAARDAARPPGPRLCPCRRPAARIAPLLGPRISPSGAHAGKLGRIVVDSPHDAVSFTQSARAARRQFCHSLSGADRRCSRG